MDILERLREQAELLSDPEIDAKHVKTSLLALGEIEKLRNDLKHTHDDVLPRWRFDELRKHSIRALHCATALLRNAEEGNYLDKTEAYLEIVELVKALSEGLYKGIDP